MNQVKKIKGASSELLFPTLCGGVALLAALITALVPSLFIVTVAVGSAFFGIMMHYDASRIYEKIFPILFFLAVLLLSNSLTLAALMLGVFFPGGVVMSRVIANQKRVNSAVATMFGVFAAYTVVILLLALMEYGVDFKPESLTEPFADALKSALGEAYDISKSFSDTVHPLLLPLNTIIQVTKENFVYLWYMLILYNIPTAVSLALLAIATLCYWTAKAVLRKKERSDPEKTKFFGGFDLVRISRVGGIVYSLTSLLAFFTVNPGETIFFGTINSVMAAVFCYAGASLIAFFMKMKGISPFIRYIAYVFIFVICINSTIRSLLSFIGLVDCFWHLRRFIPPTAKYL